MALIAGAAPLPVMVLLWLFYLSLFHASRIFLGYQWDTLLLETGFLAIFMAPLAMSPGFPPSAEPTAGVRWLLWWLLFRLMFSSGLAKLRTGDRTWRSLTALCYHYETQPLPTPLSWHAHRLPVAFHKFSTLIMFAIELVAPFLIFTTPTLRSSAGIAFIFLMLLIHLTGNYCFFNLLGIALSILLFDDRALAPIFRNLLGTAQLSVHAIEPAAAQQWLGIALAALILLLSAPVTLRLFGIEIPWPRPVERLFDLLEPFHLVNSYGLFSVMTTFRPEIVVEGSDDGVDWLAYEFKWKPGDPKRRPRFVAPHQPRLDWQMWFAALGYFANNLWFKSLLTRLLEGSPPVLALLGKNPFPGGPPKYIRAVLYHYRFTTVAERAATGAWWKGERRGFYCPAFRLGSDMEGK